MLKRFVKSTISIFPGGEELLLKISDQRQLRYLSSLYSGFENPKEIFTAHFRNNSWGSSESVSGKGSTIAATAGIRESLKDFFVVRDVQVLFDAPCGDFNWFQKLRKEVHLSYTGADIVSEIIVKNNELYADDRTTFIELDITKDSFPLADVWMCRDCLFHLSYTDIKKTLKQFVQSDIPLALITTHLTCTRNSDIPTGHMRELNLELAPFHLPSPELVFDDFEQGAPSKHLALWTKEQLSPLF